MQLNALNADSAVLSYYANWTALRDLIGWGPAQCYWGLLPWQPELAQATLPWIAEHASIPFPHDRKRLRAVTAGWVATREVPYALAAKRLLESELITNATGWHTRPSLEQGVFLQNWLHCLGWLLDGDCFEADFVESLLDGIAGQAAHLSGRICPASMNWRVADAAHLLKAGLLLSHHPDSARWRALSVRILNDALWRQIHPDGSHSEHNPHYHVWMTQEWTCLWRLARKRPDLGLRIPSEAVARMWNYALFCNRPNGTENGLHDSRGWFSGGRPDAEQRDRAAFLQEAGLPVTPPSPHGWFPDAGQALLRDIWQADGVYLTFDASRWGEGHCHYSRNSLQLHAFGRTLLADPGVFEYAPTPLGQYGRSTRAHTTLNLNGWNQAQTNPSRTFFRSTEGYVCIRSDYEGTYHPGHLSMICAGDLGRGLWASHHRCLFWAQGRAAVVFDSFVRVPDLGETEAQAPVLESNWQLGPGSAHWDERERRLVTDHADANLLILFPACPPGLTAHLHTGEMNPPRGWVSELYSEWGEDVPNCGKPIPAPMLSLTVNPLAGARAEFVSVLIPFQGKAAPLVRATAEPATLTRPGHLNLAWPDGSMDDYTWTYRFDVGLGAHGAWETDASLLYVTRDPAGRQRGVALEATYVKPFRKEVLDQPDQILFEIP